MFLWQSERGLSHASPITLGLMFTHFKINSYKVLLLIKIFSFWLLQMFSFPSQTFHFKSDVTQAWVKVSTSIIQHSIQYIIVRIQLHSPDLKQCTKGQPGISSFCVLVSCRVVFFLSHSIRSIIVVPHEWIEGTHLSPAHTQLLVSVAFESTHICPNQRNPVQPKQQHSYNTQTHTHKPQTASNILNTHNFSQFNNLKLSLQVWVKKPQNMRWDSD